MIFEIRDLWVSVDGKEVLKGINLEIEKGEVHALMGRNGTGKTTLAYTLMGHPKYEVKCGKIILNGTDITEMSPDERAKRRLFLAFQYPVAVPGVTVANFLRTSIRSVHGDKILAKDIRKMIKAELVRLQIPESFMTRSLNEGFSGGEKKKLETLQMRLLQPSLAVLDETDSGLDIDALRLVSESVDQLRSPERGILLITHYQRMLNYVKPDQVHVLIDGKIEKSGGPELAEKLERDGYDWLHSKRESQQGISAQEGR